MSRAARFVAVAMFALAYLSQPLGLDGCSLSCEAARAARGAVVAAPCHHSSSCATQIAQPTAAGDRVTTVVAVVPSVAVTRIESPAIVLTPTCLLQSPQHFSPPLTPLRI